MAPSTVDQADDTPPLANLEPTEEEDSLLLADEEIVNERAQLTTLNTWKPQTTSSGASVWCWSF